jgi:hypothetical protein
MYLVVATDPYTSGRLATQYGRRRGTRTMTDLQWTVRDIDPDEEIPEPEQWPEDELEPADDQEEADGSQN